MLTESRAEQIFSEAMHLANTGLAGEAATRLQSLIHDLAPLPALRAQRESAFKGLLRILFDQGRDARLSKVFRHYAAEYGEISDPDFDNLYIAGLLATRTAPTPLRRRNRFLNLVRRFESTLPLAGLVAECGCFQGLSSYILCSRLKRQDPAFNGAGYRIFDSFQGLSAPQPEDLRASDSDEAARIQPNISAGKYAAALARVQRSLAQFPGTAYFPGWIPDAFPRTDGDRYRFVHVDVDLYQPTRDSFEYFWPRLAPGGVMVCDDYNWPGAKQAVDEFCARHSLQCEITPTLQACIVRRA